MNRYLMKFLQIQSPKFKTSDLNPLLREVADKYSRHLQGRIRFDLILDRNIPRLEVDEEQIAEVFVNIIENAIDALPEGGELEIRSRWQPKNPRGAEIVFRDNGKGMDEDQLKHDLHAQLYDQKGRVWHRPARMPAHRRRPRRHDRCGEPEGNWNENCYLYSRGDRRPGQK